MIISEMGGNHQTSILNCFLSSISLYIRDIFTISTDVELCWTLYLDLFCNLTGGKNNPLFKTCPFWCKKMIPFSQFLLPPRKLTYPPKMAFWVDDFPNFPRWDMLIPWSVEPRIWVLMNISLYLLLWNVEEAKIIPPNCAEHLLGGSSQLVSGYKDHPHDYKPWSERPFGRGTEQPDP